MIPFTPMPIASTVTTFTPARARPMTSRYGTRPSHCTSWTAGAASTFRPITTYSTVTSSAAGAAIHRFARNLSRMEQPWVLVAATVVSEMKDRLSPKKAPPMTTAVTRGTPTPVSAAMPAAMGTRATIVPTLVPMAIELPGQDPERGVHRRVDGADVLRRRRERPRQHEDPDHQEHVPVPCSGREDGDLVIGLLHAPRDEDRVRRRNDERRRDRDLVEVPRHDG